MPVNYIKLGMMKAEFEDACRQIDKASNDAQSGCLKGAYEALLNGDTAARDRFCNKAESSPEVAAKAKQEAGLRIAEKHGLDRDAVEAVMRRHLATN